MGQSEGINPYVHYTTRTVAYSPTYIVQKGMGFVHVVCDLKLLAESGPKASLFLI